VDQLAGAVAKADSERRTATDEGVHALNDEIARRDYLPLKRSLKRFVYLLCYRFLDISGDGMIQRVKYRAHLSDDARDIHHRGNALPTVLDRLSDDLQLDAELGKMRCLSPFCQDE
jgi:hypothetical protein